MRFREQRFPSVTELRVMYGDEVRRVQLVNISATGARLEQVWHLPEDALVTLCHLHVRIPARVVWSNERQTGIRFVMPLTTTDMNALRGAIGRSPGSWESGSHYRLRELS